MSSRLSFGIVRVIVPPSEGRSCTLARRPKSARLLGSHLEACRRSPPPSDAASTMPSPYAGRLGARPEKATRGRTKSIETLKLLNIGRDYMLLGPTVAK